MSLWKLSINAATVAGVLVSANVFASASQGVTPIKSDILSGTWEAKCQAVEDGEDESIFIAGRVTFADGSLGGDFVVYQDAACTQTLQATKRTGTYVLGGSHGDGVKIDATDDSEPGTLYGTVKVVGDKLWWSEFVGNEADRPTTYGVVFDRVKP